MPQSRYKRRDNNAWNLNNGSAAILQGISWYHPVTNSTVRHLRWLAAVSHLRCRTVDNVILNHDGQQNMSKSLGRTAFVNDHSMPWDDQLGELTLCNDTKWWHRSWLLAQPLAWCFMAPSHYLNRWSLIIIMVQQQQSEDHVTRYTSVINR